jgi:hypothetical protein
MNYALLSQSHFDVIAKTLIHNSQSICELDNILIKIKHSLNSAFFGSAFLSKWLYMKYAHCLNICESVSDVKVSFDLEAHYKCDILDLTKFDGLGMFIAHLNELLNVFDKNTVTGESVAYYILQPLARCSIQLWNENIPSFNITNDMIIKNLTRSSNTCDWDYLFNPLVNSDPSPSGTSLFLNLYEKVQHNIFSYNVYFSNKNIVAKHLMQFSNESVAVESINYAYEALNKIILKVKNSDSCAFQDEKENIWTQTDKEHFLKMLDLCRERIVKIFISSICEGAKNFTQLSQSDACETSKVIFITSPLDLEHLIEPLEFSLKQNTDLSCSSSHIIQTLCKKGLRFFETKDQAYLYTESIKKHSVHSLELTADQFDRVIKFTGKDFSTIVLEKLAMIMNSNSIQNDTKNNSCSKSDYLHLKVQCIGS